MTGFGLIQIPGGDVLQVCCSHSELVPISALKPNPKNPNKHTPEQIKLLAKIMNHQGVRSPIVVSNRSGLMTKGHGRLEAAKHNKWTHFPVDFQDYATPEDEYADMVADNEVARLAKADLGFVLKEVLDFGPDFDFDLLGIPDFKLPEEFEPQCDEDSVPEQVEPKTKPGDVYQLGRHRLMCGDSTNIDQVEKLMAGQQASMVFTDPPYGVSYEDSLGRSLKNDDLTGERLEQFITDAVASGCVVSDPNAAWFVWHASRFQREFENALNKNDLKVKQQIIWVKGKGEEGTSHVAAPAIGRSHFRWLHEPCFYATRGSPYNKGDRKTTTVWTVSRPTRGTDHPTQKPIALIEIALENSSKPREAVLDLFGGSGSTLIACEKAERNCFVMELDPKYCDVIVARWEAYTGQKGDLVGGI